MIEEHVPEPASSFKTVNRKIAIDRNDVFDIQTFANRHKQAIGKVHWQIAVFEHERRRSQEVRILRLDHLDGAGGDPEEEIPLGFDAEIEDEHDLRHNGQRRNQFERPSLEELDGLS